MEKGWDWGEQNETLNPLGVAKMAGRLILAWRSSSSSSSSSPAFCLMQNRLYRRLPRHREPITIYPFHPYDPADAGKLAKAQSSEHWELFQTWMKNHKKRYRGEKEMLCRFEIFTNCVKFIEEKNKELEGYQLGLNNYSDLTDEEFPRGLGRGVGVRFVGHR